MFINYLIILLILLNINGILSCVYNGNTYPNGAEWMEKSAFVMRCTIFNDKSWRAEVVACALPDLRRVPIHTSLEDGNFVWQCKQEDDKSIRLIQAPSQNALCNGIHPVGSVWHERSFELECMPGGFSHLRSCVTEEGKRIPVNDTRNINGFEMECIQFGNGTVIFRGSKNVPRAETLTNQNNNQIVQPPINQRPTIIKSASRPIISTCKDENGENKYIGEYWVENYRFNKTCREGGAVQVVNCVTKDGYRIPLNGQLIQNGMKFECTLTSQGTIKFRSDHFDQV